MPIKSLHAHFDGEQICLDEPFSLKPNTKLLVTILPEEESEKEHEDWLLLSAQGLSKAYGDDEPEYSLSLIKEVNSGYKRR